MNRSSISFLICATLCAAGVASAQTLSFTCNAKGSGETHTLSPSAIYAKAGASLPYGFDLVAPPNVVDGSCSSDKPFFFSVAVPDGDYEVTLDLGGKQASITTVRGESRRLFVQQLKLAPKASKVVAFNVAVRTASIYPAPGEAAAAGDLPQVKLKPREIGALDWDEKLTLEFNGERPSFRSVKVRRLTSVPTVYLAGDSTVVDQDKEPWAAWGQMLPVFFGPSITIANEAESGETIRSFIGERRFAKIMSTIKPGDFLMIQFAHNDQKAGSGYVPAATDYKDYLRQYIADARKHGATPILVTSMNRRSFDAEGKIRQTLGDYPAAMREVAAEQKVALIDLNALSKTLFEAMGPEGTLKAFVHYPANTFPGQADELKDDTHFNAYGAYELARAIVQDIRNQHLPLEKHLRPGIPPFNPAQPDALNAFSLPASPLVSTATPYGR